MTLQRLVFCFYYISCQLVVKNDRSNFICCLFSWVAFVSFIRNYYLFIIYLSIIYHQSTIYHLSNQSIFFCSKMFSLFCKSDIFENNLNIMFSDFILLFFADHSPLRLRYSYYLLCVLIQSCIYFNLSTYHIL